MNIKNFSFQKKRSIEFGSFYLILNNNEKRLKIRD